MYTAHYLAILQAGDLTPLGQRLIKETLAAVKGSTADNEADDKVTRFKAWWTSTYQDPFEYARLKANMHLITQNLVEILSADYLELTLQKPSNFLADICRVSADPESPHKEILIQRPLEQLDLDTLHVEHRLQRLAGKGFLKTMSATDSSDSPSNLEDLFDRDLILLNTFKERGAIDSEKHERISRGIAKTKRAIVPDGTNSSWWSRREKKRDE